MWDVGIFTSLVIVKVMLAGVTEMPKAGSFFFFFFFKFFVFFHHFSGLKTHSVKIIRGLELFYERGVIL